MDWDNLLEVNMSLSKLLVIPDTSVSYQIHPNICIMLINITLIEYLTSSESSSAFEFIKQVGGKRYQYNAGDKNFTHPLVSEI